MRQSASCSSPSMTISMPCPGNMPTVPTASSSWSAILCEVYLPSNVLPLYWLLETSVQKIVTRRMIEHATLLADAGETGYNRKVLSCAHATAEEIYPSSRRRSSFCEPCSSLSQAADSSLLGQTPHSLFSLDETAHSLIAAGNHGRSWEKQVRTHGRKRTFTPPTRHAQAASETASMYEGGSVAPRSTGTDGADLETSARHRSTRNTSALAPSALPPLLEAEVKGSVNTRDGVSGDHCVDQRDGKEQSP